MVVASVPQLLDAAETQVEVAPEVEDKEQLWMVAGVKVGHIDLNWRQE